MNSCTGF